MPAPPPDWGVGGTAGENPCLDDARERVPTGRGLAADGGLRSAQAQVGAPRDLGVTERSPRRRLPVQRGSCPDMAVACQVDSGRQAAVPARERGGPGRGNLARWESCSCPSEAVLTEEIQPDGAERRLATPSEFAHAVGGGPGQFVCQDLWLRMGRAWAVATAANRSRGGGRAANRPFEPPPGRSARIKRRDLGPDRVADPRRDPPSLKVVPAHALRAAE